MEQIRMKSMASQCTLTMQFLAYLVDWQLIVHSSETVAVVHPHWIPERSPSHRYGHCVEGKRAAVRNGVILNAEFEWS